MRIALLLLLVFLSVSGIISQDSKIKEKSESKDTKVSDDAKETKNSKTIDTKEKENKESESDEHTNKDENESRKVDPIKDTKLLDPTMIQNFNVPQVGSFKIITVVPRDFQRNIFSLTIRSKNAEEILKYISENTGAIRFGYKVGDIDMLYARGSTRQWGDDIEIEIFSKKEMIPQGPQKFRLILIVGTDEHLLSEFIYNVPSKKLKPGEQPIINKISPGGGTVGDTITLEGDNFGNDIESIFVQYIRMEPNESYQFKDDIIEIGYPIFLSRGDGSGGKQIIKFTIPKRLEDKLSKKVPNTFLGKADHFFSFGHTIKIKLMVGYRPSVTEKIVVMSPNWRVLVGAISIIVVFLLLGLIAIVMQKLNYWHNALLDEKNNSYSLSKFQAFAWTIVLAGGYFYVAIGSMLILRKGNIPDFNVSLIGLMAISYGGMLSAKVIDGKKPSNELRTTPPSIKNLFCIGEEIDMARLQLFVFTIVTLLVYVNYLFNTNVLEGLPTIPPTLQALLGASQSGYLGGKALGSKIGMNIINPSKASVTQKTMYITVIGSGFQAGMQVMVEGGKAVEIIFKGPSTFECDLPLHHKIGKFDLVLISPSGSPIVASSAIEILSEEDYQKYLKEEKLEGEKKKESPKTEKVEAAKQDTKTPEPPKTPEKEAKGGVIFKEAELKLEDDDYDKPKDKKK